MGCGPRLLRNREDIAMDDPLYPILEMVRSSKPAETWADLPSSTRTTIIDRDKYNNDNFVRIGDFRQEIPAGWSVDGLGLLAGPSRSGEYSVATEGYRAVEGVSPSGLFTNRLSDRMNGALRSPLLPKDKKYISLQVLGEQDRRGENDCRSICVIGEDDVLRRAPNAPVGSSTIIKRPANFLFTSSWTPSPQDNPRSARAARQVRRGERCST